MVPIITHYADFKRLNLDNDNDKESFVDDLIGVPCNIQPVSSNPAEIATGMFGKSHTMFVSATYSGIREGQRVTVSGYYDGELNRQLIVEGVSDWSKGVLNYYQINLNALLK